MSVYKQLDKAYERHAIREQKLRLAGKYLSAEPHHEACVILLNERIANEDSASAPLRDPCQCEECLAVYVVR